MQAFAHRTAARWTRWSSTAPTRYTPTPRTCAQRARATGPTQGPPGTPLRTHTHTSRAPKCAWQQIGRGALPRASGHWLPRAAGAAPGMQAAARWRTSAHAARRQHGPVGRQCHAADHLRERHAAHDAGQPVVEQQHLAQQQRARVHHQLRLHTCTQARGASRRAKSVTAPQRVEPCCPVAGALAMSGRRQSCSCRVRRLTLVERGTNWAAAGTSVDSAPSDCAQRKATGPVCELAPQHHRTAQACAAPLTVTWDTAPHNARPLVLPPLSPAHRLAVAHGRHKHCRGSPSQANPSPARSGRRPAGAPPSRPRAWQTPAAWTATPPRTRLRPPHTRVQHPRKARPPPQHPPCTLRAFGPTMAPRIPASAPLTLTPHSASPPPSRSCSSRPPAPPACGSSSRCCLDPATRCSM